MSAQIVLRIPGDTNQFKQFVESHAEQLAEVSNRAKGMGCRHHQFAIGDGYVLVIDEWDSAAQFMEFFQDPEIAQIMQEGGAQGEPEIMTGEIMASADRF